MVFALYIYNTAYPRKKRLEIRRFYFFETTSYNVFLAYSTAFRLHCSSALSLSSIFPFFKLNKQITIYCSFFLLIFKQTNYCITGKKMLEDHSIQIFLTLYYGQMLSTLFYDYIIRNSVRLYFYNMQWDLITNIAMGLVFSIFIYWWASSLFLTNVSETYFYIYLRCTIKGQS